jgi:hypothetical protein
VPPYAIVGGTPAKILRYRFADTAIQRMLTTKWWRFDINDLAGVSFENPTAALDEIIRREEVGDVQEACR